jgi:nitrogen regulatory protein PII-like uncharacterized protein
MRTQALKGLTGFFFLVFRGVGEGGRGKMEADEQSGTACCGSLEKIAAW